MQDITTFIMLHPWLSLAAVTVFVLVLIIELIRAKRRSTSLSPSELTHLINHEQAVIVDARSAENYRNGHIIDAISMTSDEVKQIKKLEKFRSRPVIFVCQNGIESQKLAAFLKKHGYNATSLAGGIRSWIDAQMPLVKE